MLLTDILEKVPELRRIPSSNALPTTSKTETTKTENKEQESKLIFLIFSSQFDLFFLFQGISECKVEVTYVDNPSLFFVRKVATKSEFLQFEKDLTAYGNEQNLETPINIKQSTLRSFAMAFICERIFIVFVLLQMTCVSSNNGKSTSGIEDA